MTPTPYIRAVEHHGRQCCTVQLQANVIVCKNNFAAVAATGSHRDEASNPKLSLIASERPQNSALCVKTCVGVWDFDVCTKLHSE